MTHPGEQFYPEGVRWDDPKFQITWPITPSEISPKDEKWPDFNPIFHGIEQLRGL